MRINLFLSTILLFGLFNLVAFAQTTTVIKPSAISGDVISVSGGNIFLETKDGIIEAVLSDKTQYFRVPPENPTRTNHSKNKLADESSLKPITRHGVMRSMWIMKHARSCVLSLLNPILVLQWN